MQLPNGVNDVSSSDNGRAATVKGIEPLISRRELSEILRLSEQTLQYWTHHRLWGPPFVKVGRRICYRRSDVEGWIMERTEPGTRKTK